MKKLLSLFLLLCTINFAFALSIEQINSIGILFQQSAAAAQRGDAKTACNKTKEAILLWGQVDPKQLLGDALNGYLEADANVKNATSAYLRTCSRF